MKRTVGSSVGEVTVRENGLVVVRTFPNVSITLRDAIDYLSMVTYLTRGKPHCTIMDISGIVSIDLDAMDFLVKGSNAWGNTIALALIANGHTAKMIGRSFVAVTRSEYPVQIFTELTSAYHWARIEYLRRITRAAS